MEEAAGMAGAQGTWGGLAVCPRPLTVCLWRGALLGSRPPRGSGAEQWAEGRCWGSVFLALGLGASLWLWYWGSLHLPVH